MTTMMVLQMCLTRLILIQMIGETAMAMVLATQKMRSRLTHWLAPTEISILSLIIWILTTTMMALPIKM